MGLAAQLPEIDDAGPVRELGSDIDAAAQDAFDIIAGVSEIWFKLNSTYEAPEAPKIYNGMRDPLELVQDNKKIAHNIKQALDDYATKLDEFKNRKHQLELDIIAAEAAMAAAKAMPETKTETDSEGNDHEVPNDERQRAIDDAQKELDRIEGEIRKLCDDVEQADQALASRIDNLGEEPPEAPKEAPEGDPKGRSSNGLIRFFQGAKDAVVDTGKALWGLGVLAKDGAVSAWKHRKQIFEATKKLDDFVKDGGLGRMADSAGKAISTFSPKDAASAAWRGTKNFTKNEWQEFKEDPAYYVGYLAPDLIGTVATGGTAGAAKVGVTVAAKSAVKATATNGVRAAAKVGMKEGAEAYAASRAKAATRQSVSARVLASAKSTTANGYNKVAQATGLRPLTQGTAKAANGHAGNVMNISTREVANNAASASKAGTGTARPGVSNVAEATSKQVDDAPVRSNRPDSPSGTSGTTDRPAVEKPASSSESAPRAQSPRAEEVRPEPARANSAKHDDPIDDASDDLVNHSDEASKHATSGAKVSGTDSNAGSGVRASGSELVDQADEVTPKSRKSDVDHQIELDDNEAPVRRGDDVDSPSNSSKEAPEAEANTRRASEADANAKQTANADGVRTASVAERTSVDEALDSTNDLAKTSKDDVAEIDASDAQKTDKPDAGTPSAREAAEASAAHTDDVAKVGKESTENAAAHADDVVEKGKPARDADDVKAEKDRGDSDGSHTGDHDGEKSAGAATREVAEHADDAPRAASAARGEDLEIADGRKAAGIEVDEEKFRHEKAELLQPHEDGPLGDTRDTIETAHKPVDDSHFSQHHHANESMLEQKPSISADEFYEKSAREALIEDARAKGDLDRVAALEKVDIEDVRAEYHQLKFDEYVERQAIPGEEFDFENNLKDRPEEKWRGTDIQYSVNEGAYVKDNGSLLPESLPDKIEWKKGEAPKPQIRVVDYVNENMREVTVQIGRNKVVYRQYPDYIESEAVIFDKFTTVKRADGTQANKALLDAGSFQMDPEDPSKKLMRTDDPDMPVDEKGHLLAHMFAPNLGSGNYLAQHHMVNKQTIYNMEMIQSDAIMNEDSFTHFSTRATLDSNGRPTAYHAVADIYDRETGKQWMRIDGSVHNDEHDFFHRDPKKSKVDTYGRDFSAKALSEVKAKALDSGSVPRIHFDQVNQH